MLDTEQHYWSGLIALASAIASGTALRRNRHWCNVSKSAISSLTRLVERQILEFTTSRSAPPSEILERIYLFEDIWNFEVIPAGWYPSS